VAVQESIEWRHLERHLAAQAAAPKYRYLVSFTGTVPRSAFVSQVRLATPRDPNAARCNLQVKAMLRFKGVGSASGTRECGAEAALYFYSAMPDANTPLTRTHKQKRRLPEGKRRSV